MLSVATETARESALRQALFRGHLLTMENPAYARAAEAILGTLLAEDREPGDLTVSALGLELSRPSTAKIVARQAGAVAGIQEARWLFERTKVWVTSLKCDGDSLAPGDTVLELSGSCNDLLSLERVGLNVLQRMSGIATATRSWQQAAQRASASAFVVATRKTPWGMLDKRAVHCGGGGTHRLGLGDAILVKNNHLAMLGETEAEAAAEAVDLVWPRRAHAAFVEVEVRSLEGARAAARAFLRHATSHHEPDAPPCLLLLDNQTPEQIAAIIAALRAESLWDHVLIEASGQITEATVADYAAAGADAISGGALTHSVLALDLHQRMTQG